MGDYQPELEPGCYVDGHWGRYGTGRVIELAVDFGWDDEEARELLYHAPTSPPDFDDASYDISQDAELWLNENVAPEGFSFGWYDGEFFLWSDEEWENE